MSTNQDINVSGANNVIRVIGSGKMRVGNQSVDVSGEGNSVVVASSGDLHIGGKNPVHRKKAPPMVRRGQVWAHKTITVRRMYIVSVRDEVALCVAVGADNATLTRNGKPITARHNIINIRYGWDLVRGAQDV